MSGQRGAGGFVADQYGLLGLFGGVSGERHFCGFALRELLFGLVRGHNYRLVYFRRFAQVDFLFRRQFGVIMSRIKNGCTGHIVTMLFWGT